MNIRPLADRVLIKPAAAEEKTLGGIIIPDSAKEKPLKGEIVAGETPDDHNNGGPQRALAGGEHGAALIHQSEEAQDLGDGAHLRGV